MIRKKQVKERVISVHHIKERVLSTLCMVTESTRLDMPTSQRYSQMRATISVALTRETLAIARSKKSIEG